MIVMDNYTLINRVSMMEYRYDKVRRVLDELEKAVARYEDAKEEIKVLEEYMESGQWLRDFEADEAGEIPAGVKRGVLSEDALYDLLTSASSFEL